MCKGVSFGPGGPLIGPINYRGFMQPAPNPLDHFIAMNPRYHDVLEMKLEVSFGMNMAMKGTKLW